MPTIPKQSGTKKHPKPAPFDLGASDLSVITKKLISNRCESIINTHLKKRYWNKHVKGSVRGRCEFSGMNKEWFWSPKFIPKILDDAIYEILQQTAETCPKDNLKWYVKEAGILLKMGLVNNVYDYMAHIDQGMRSKGGNLKSVKRVNVYDDKVPKMHKLVEQYVAAVSLKAVDPKETTTAQTEQDATPVKGGRLWTWVFKKTWHFIVTIVSFLAMLLTCIYFLWWLWTTFLA